MVINGYVVEKNGYTLDPNPICVKKMVINGYKSELLQKQVMTIETRETPTKKDKLTVRTELEKEFDAGINMDKCIKLLSLTDNELIQETLLNNETEESIVHEYSSTEEEYETPKIRINYKEPQIPNREIYMDQGGPSNWQLVPHQGDAEMYDSYDATHGESRKLDSSFRHSCLGVFVFLTNMFIVFLYAALK